MVVLEMKKHFQLRAIEWWSAGVMTTWGFMVLANPGLFLDNHSATILLSYAPQHIWGLAALGAGGLRLVALFINGIWYRSPAVRWLTTMVSIFIWFCITAAFYSSPVMNLGVVIYSWQIVADLYSAYRSAGDFIEAEAQRQYKAMPTLPDPSDAAKGDRDNVHRLTAG